MPRDSNTDRIASVEDDMVAIRERITRVETSLEANEAAAQARHHELLAAFQDMRTRQDALQVPETLAGPFRKLWPVPLTTLSAA